MNPVRFVHWQVWRYIARHPLLTLLNVLSIASGVAVFFAIQLANTSANHAFSATVDLVAGKSQLEVTAPRNDLPDDAFPLVQKMPGVTAATPLVRGLVTLPDFPGEYLDVLGVDVFTNAPFRTFQLTNFSSRSFDLARWLGDPDSIAITDRLADRLYLHAGEQLRIQVNGRNRMMRVGFVMSAPEFAAANEHIAAMDIGWAQELFEMRGRLSSIQLRIERSAATNRTSLIGRLRAQLPGDVEVAPPAQRGEEVDKMLASFQLNLTAMSLVSLFVGAFLIYNTISASVTRRRREIGILRSLGVSRFQIGMIFLIEAISAACGGTVLGLVFGLLLARGLTRAVSETISSLYVLVSVQKLAVDLTSVIAAVALGILCAVLAAFKPARSAALMPPVAALRFELISEETKRISMNWVWIGVSAAAFTFLCSFIALRTGPAWWSFVAAFFCLAGMSCFAPFIGRAVARLVESGSRRRLLEPEIAAINLRRSLARNSVTIAALASAIAMSIGVGVMIFSFRNTVQTWIGQTLVADIFVGPASNEITGPTSFLPRDVISYFESAPMVAAVDTFREIELPFRSDGAMALVAIRAAGPRAFVLLHGNQAELMQRFRDQPCVVVSESFARRNQLHSGNQLEIRTPEGGVKLPVLAVVRDYSRDQGLVFTSEKTFNHLFHDDRVNSIGIYLKPGTNGERVSADFRNRFSGRGEFAIYSNQALRTRAFEIFEQTFSVTYVLRVIAVIIAISGVVLSLMTLIIERSRTLAIMRALGTSPRQLRRIVLWESLLVAMAANILGMVSGIALAMILTAVVNPSFFGWTIPLHIPWSMLASTPLWILLSAVCAALIPAIRASRLHLADVLRSE